jgi:hypothetical protein
MGRYVVPPIRLTGLVVGHEFTPEFEADVEFYSQGTFHLSYFPPMLDVGGRYKIHSPVILLFMAGRSLERTSLQSILFCCLFRATIPAAAAEVLQSRCS